MDALGRGCERSAVLLAPVPVAAAITSTVVALGPLTTGLAGPVLARIPLCCLTWLPHSPWEWQEGGCHNLRPRPMPRPRPPPVALDSW